MTAVSNGQITVNSIEEMLQRFEEARFIDCRISAYPKLPKGTLHIPKIILIDLDIDWSLKTAHILIKKSLNKTLRNIKEYCRCSDNEIVIPLVLWTGNGYHIYVVLNIPEPLEDIDEYESLGIKEISREFMLFAKSFLSDNKADSKNSPSFESCLLRVPYSLNSKCLSKGIGVGSGRIKITQNWNGHVATMNEIPLLLSGFYTYLVNKKSVAAQMTSNYRRKRFDSLKNNNSILWIETLLQNGLAEHRKYVASLILVPYLVNIKALSDTDTIVRLIKEWLSKCSKLRQLDPVYDFDCKIRYYIERCRTNKSLKPIRLDKLQQSNNDLYRTIKSR